MANISAGSWGPPNQLEYLKRFGTFDADVLDGEFQIPLSDGPPLGEYVVIVQPIEPDSEEAFEQLRQRQPVLLQDRNRFLQAVRLTGPIRVELTPEDTNVLTIELTSRRGK